MNHHVSMTVVDAGNNLLKETTSLRFFKFAVLDDVFEQFASAYELHDHENVGRCADHLIPDCSKSGEILFTKQIPLIVSFHGSSLLQFDDMRMSK